MFWVLRGTHDVWLKFAQLPKQPTTESERDREQFLLTIVEEYAALVFRTLPPDELAKRLPPEFEVQPYAWAGLNVCDPLDQLINGPRSCKKGSKNSKMGRLGLRMHEEFWRHADISKGDFQTVLTVCGECKDSSTGRIDKEPLFEVPSGIYLAMSKNCDKCGRRRSHVPKDQSHPWKTFDSAKKAYLRSKGQLPADVVDFTIMTSYELALWIQSHGHRAAPSAKKCNLLARAEDIRKGLLGNPNFRPTTALAEKPTVSSGEFGKKVIFSERDNRIVLPQWMFKGSSWRQ
ncbi:hypothetical protein CORC01_04262 [Colletotrichum orchidophilum]|uniref:Uncharacterized protein n=1 Tax=Colletotrichum orchidophilum TaxID=1209926 RepID=A0A1G4BGE8_9PEZI|nr:uncharacterized protein CORC01_04262 [Colletotrichum orchidophilum]OHF00512.1 hypothetical protein CORC01_04262 [Colletotrichum orchidophilum]